MKRITTHPETHTKAGFDEKLHCFGTLTVAHTVENQEETKKTKTRNGKKPELPKSFEQFVYESYKQRNEIEIMFDSYKNYLETDASYMQNRSVLEGWLFANFVAKIAYYKLYVRL